jgi:hypothetical protein
MPWWGKNYNQMNFSKKNNLMPKAKSCRMLKRWLYSYKNNCLIGLSHHILVLSNLSTSLFNMLKLKMLIMYHPCSFAILLKGQWKIHSICASNKKNLFQLLVKDLACFCEFCSDSRWTYCQNIQWIGPWVPKQLQPHDTWYVWEAMYESWDGD